MVTCINLVKALAVFLKPFVPNMVEKIEKQLGLSLSWDDYRFSLRNMKMGTTEKLVRPLETKQFDALHVGGGEAGAGKEESQEGLIDIDQFAAVDLRVGTIKQADRVPKSDKLLKLQLDTGSGTRQIIAGIGKYYAPEELVGRSVVFVANLKPAKLMGEKSEGMVLAAQKGKKLTLLRPDDQIGPGARIS
jgi:methionyl-tRNA synthetase